jgi:hypothetical protein
MGMGLGIAAHAQAITTTTVQGTVYLANGQPGTGTLVVSWPSFTTANGQLVTADSTTIAIAPNGFVSVNLAPNLGATPTGLFYTAVYYMSDGSTNTQYWVVPTGTQATLGEIQAQLMPAAQAVQAVSKTYVDQAIAAESALDLPLTGGTLTGSLTAIQIGALYQVDQFPGMDFGAKLGACLSGLSATNGGTCDARNFTSTQSMGSNLTISTANATILLPCITISTANQLIVTAGTRNVSLRGCSLRGASTASGSQGGTLFLYSGTGAMVQVGDPTYAVDTNGFHMDNAAINITTATSSTAQGFVAYRTQELDLESLYFLGNSNQTGMTLDGTGNYTGGTFLDNQFDGFLIAVNAIGHQISNPATTDWMNASEFVRLHIDCATSGGNPVAGSYGIDLQQGDGNTFTGGDVEDCSTALHLGANAQNNTIVGLRNEGSTNQIVADAGSSYNSWITGGTMFTGQLTDNGTRNSFLDTFHRSFNGMNGDWYGSQKDATVTNHYRLGIGTGNERGLLDRYQTDYGYRWTIGLSDATAGEQFYQILDELNSVYRVSIGQYNNGQSSTNNQTVINSAGTGAVVLNGSNNSGTGGVIFGSGGASETTVATINSAGNAQFNGTLQVAGASTFTSSTTVKNQADAEIDQFLWAGLTTSQKESFIYKDWNGGSQWYVEKDANNNWELNSAIGGLDSFKAYQSTNSGDTYINTSNAAGAVRINYETGAGTQFKVYGGSSSSLYASFTGTAAIQFPGLAAGSGHNCLQIDSSGYMTNTGAACGTGNGTGTVSSGTSGQIAYYNGTGTSLSGTNTVSIAAGGTGASTAPGALADLGAAAISGAAFTGPVSISNTLSVGNITSIGPRYDVTNSIFGAAGNGTMDDTAAIQAAFNTCWHNGIEPTGGIVEFPGPHTYVVSSTINAYDGCHIEGTSGSASSGSSRPSIAWNGAAAGVVYNITGFTAAVNSTPFYAPSSPAPYAQPYLVTFNATNNLTVGQWVDIQGLSTAAGLGLNRTIAQVGSANGSSFTVVIPFSPTLGTFTDSGTATSANVVIAFDAAARRQESISNIAVTNMLSTQANTFNVGFYFGDRVDTGARVLNVQAADATEYGYYFADGGINVDFDKGWRSDGAGVAGIYWKVTSSDSFGIANGTVDNNRSALGSATSGAAVMLDNANCVNTSGVHFTSRNTTIAINSSLTPGLGAFTLYDCPSNSTMEAFWMDLENTWLTPASPTTAGFNFPSFVVSPPNDAAVSLNILNGAFPSGTSPNTTTRWVGIPELLRTDLYGTSGWIPMLSYAPSTNSDGGNSGDKSPISLIGDVNVGQLWQYGIPASDYLYSDTAFTALPNATTLFAGQILAPPAYWSGANGKRYAIDIVYQSGTTGTPNGGATTCTGTSGTSILTCTSATDLSAGQRITIGTDTNKTIAYVDASYSSAVLVNLTSNLASTYSTATALSFSTPVVGPEIQMPTKSSSAPTSLAWSQGDLEQNSGAAVNGVAAWVNVGAGTPGTWAGIPLGNSSGQINSSQISNLAFQSLTTAGTSGAATLSGGVLNIPSYGGGVSSINSATGAFTFTGSGVSCSSTTCTFTGISIPASANALSSNSSSQLVASTSHNLSVPANCVAASSSGTAYTCSSTPTFTPATGDHIQFKADVANTGNATLAVNGTSAATIKKWGGAGNLTANDLLAGHWISATFDGTYWQLDGQLGNANATEINGTQITGLSGSGSVLALTTSPTIASPIFTGNATTFANGAASQDYLVLQPGTGGTDQIGAFEFANYAGTSQWEIRKDASNTFRIRDTVNSVDRLVDYAGGQTVINSGGSASVAVNNTSTAGTGGFIVYEGGSNYNTAAFTVTSSGNASVPGGFTSAALTDTGLTTAGVVTTTSGGGLGSVATTGTGSAVLATSPTVSGLTDTGTENLTTLNVSGSTTLNNVTFNGSCTGAGCVQTGTPAWLMYLGTGGDGAYEATSASCTAAAPCLIEGDRYYTSFKIDSGAYVYANVATTGGGAVIHATGACTVNGTYLVNWTKNTLTNTSKGVGGGASGGSGGGTAAGTGGVTTTTSYGATAIAAYPGGSAGAASGGNGGNGGAIEWAPYLQRAMTNAGAGGLDGLELSGSTGEPGGSSGGAAGQAGSGLVMMCASLSGTGGTIDASGGPGGPATANSTGAGSGGGGGVVILSSQAAVTTWPAVYVAGGPGGLVTVPEAVATGGTCTTQPKATLGVTAGALNGTCTLVQAGAGCGTGTGITWNVLGGGGTLGTGTVNPTWSSGALASCTTTAGSSSGYTAATYTTAGTGGDGGVGWYAEFAGW